MMIRSIKRTIIATALAMTLPLTAYAADVPERGDVAAELKWDLTDMYADTQAWEADKAAFLALLPSLETYRGRLNESGEVLLEAIEQDMKVSQLISNLYVYAGLKSFEDARVSENAARWSEAQGLYGKYNETIAFFTPELLAIPEE